MNKENLLARLSRIFNSFEVPFLWSDIIAVLLKIGLFLIWDITKHESFQSGGTKSLSVKTTMLGLLLKAGALFITRTRSSASHYCPLWSIVT
jgi:hypothetical protein